MSTLGRGGAGSLRHRVASGSDQLAQERERAGRTRNAAATATEMTDPAMTARRAVSACVTSLKLSSATSIATVKPTPVSYTHLDVYKRQVFCCCVMDTFSRKIVGWSIDTVQNSNLVVNALDMALKNRQPAPGGVVHADHGVQFTSWAFTNKIREAGRMPSFGSIGEGLDNAMMESFWSSMQIELLDRKRWSTRVELANAMFEYIEVFHNRKRRHSGLGYRTPIEVEVAYERTLVPA